MTSEKGIAPQVEEAVVHEAMVDEEENLKEGITGIIAPGANRAHLDRFPDMESDPRQQQQ